MVSDSAESLSSLHYLNLRAFRRTQLQGKCFRHQQWLSQDSCETKNATKIKKVSIFPGFPFFSSPPPPNAPPAAPPSPPPSPTHPLSRISSRYFSLTFPRDLGACRPPTACVRGGVGEHRGGANGTLGERGYGEPKGRESGGQEWRSREGGGLRNQRKIFLGCETSSVTCELLPSWEGAEDGT